jgi:hypothetical protein
VIASHYAEPVGRRVGRKAELRCKPSGDAQVICSLEPGDTMLVLDDTVGWSWGYAGTDRLVGYLPSDALAAD